MPLDDAGSGPQAIGPQMLVLKVFLNGEQKTHVVAFDTRAGTMRRVKTNDEGKPVFDSLNGQYEHEDLTGDVSAVFGPE